jgi:predicted amidophosphoribosyltransferase
MLELVAVLSVLAAAARDLVLAETCAGCDRHAGSPPLCPTCRAALLPEPGPVHPLDPPEGFPPTLAAMPYASTCARLIVAHKEHGRLGLARPLGLLLAAAAAVAVDDPLRPAVLVPVPSRRAVTRQRGHDPVLRMARVAARALGRGSTVMSVLRHARRVDDQSGLSLAGRRRNVHDALVAVRPPGGDPGAVVVLVDDICSSGATLASAAVALGAVGVPRGALVASVVAAPVLRTQTAGR